MNIQVITDPLDWYKKLPTHAAQASYLCMYSSLIDAIVLDAKLMAIPIDEHMVHRGDGVFEALKAVGGRFFLLDEHLARLKKSTEMIHLPLPKTLTEIKDIILKVAEVSKEKDLLFRVYVSRGPGGFGVDPKESVGSQLYVVANKLKRLEEAHYKNGVKAAIVHDGMKDGIWAQVKSCNYLPNVMMKMQANNLGVFLTLNKTESGKIGEGSTENILLQMQDDTIVYPPFDYTLRGTTLLRLVELMKQNQNKNHFKEVIQKEVSQEDIYNAKQLMAVGTTLDVLPIVNVDGRAINDGKVSDFAMWTRKLLLEDQNPLQR